jgi:hypothetical protein
MTDTKTCRTCGLDKPLSEFSKDHRYEAVYRSDCKSCRTKQVGTYQRTEKGQLSHRRAVLKHRYNVTPEWFDATLEAQGGKCAICPSEISGTRGFRMSVDHDHACCPGSRSCGKCVRGILCLNCNNSLGWMETHRAAIAIYLRN